jgi:hypothetical protein
MALAHRTGEQLAAAMGAVSDPVTIPTDHTLQEA